MNTYKVFTGRVYNPKGAEKPFLIKAERLEVTEEKLADYINHHYYFYTGEDLIALFPDVTAIIKV